MGDAIDAGCGSCHPGGVTDSSTDATHAAHGLSHLTIEADESKCEECHPTMDYTTYVGTHDDTATSLDATKVTYTATRCTTACASRPTIGT